MHNPYQAPASNDATLATSQAKGNLFVRCWLGQAPLWQAFWIMGVGGYLAIAMWLMALIRVFGDGTIDYNWQILVMLASWLAYGIYVTVAVWRCAERASFLPVRLLARLFCFLVAAGTVGLSYSLVSAILLGPV